jgi:hypothetical protein
MKSLESLTRIYSEINNQEGADLNHIENRETEFFETEFVIELTGIVFSTSGKFESGKVAKSDNDKYRSPSMFNPESFV